MAAPQQTNWPALSQALATVSAETALIPNAPAIVQNQQLHAQQQALAQQLQASNQQTQASFQQIQAILQQLQATVQQVQATVQQVQANQAETTTRCAFSLGSSFIVVWHGAQLIPISLDGMPARIANATRELQLPLAYPPLPNNAAQPVGPGGPMPWTKLDIINYTGQPLVVFISPIHPGSSESPPFISSSSCRCLGSSWASPSAHSYSMQTITGSFLWFRVVNVFSLFYIASPPCTLVYRVNFMIMYCFLSFEYYNVPAVAYVRLHPLSPVHFPISPSIVPRLVC